MKEKKRKYIIVKQTGRNNATFKVTNPEKIAFWKRLSEAGGVSTTTQIIEEGNLKSP